ncbi:phosphoribosylglycinamide formyltransferase-1 [Clostridium cavendishii DSM 21758]|uniref:Phosphoribosylglycinamide formyltransferase n=1 Tax=Clostridium cavendishii DSM 21758 TaxID=1121302 RepID=A0A1M6NUG2_9CLOT|nr:phosphoribosylglycinamide formyltransferase [Clostridium cavendishii]SHJ99252.1 phosphoribosylglycinamide formyltransferase-1 [Clostridium cavendishii DSM 21758]
MFKIAVLVSGGGSNLQAIIDAIEFEQLNASIEFVISDKKDAYALKRAEEKNITTLVFDRKEYGRNSSDKILEVLKGKVDLIVLAGYLSILDGDILKEFNNKIINIHPSLIPSFCGPKMYGIKVHEAAINMGVRYSGCTVHYVNELVDGGAIILQQVVNVYFEDDAKTLQKRVLEEEHKLLKKAIKLIIEDKILIDNGRVKIKS